jgi:hypothetical protein
VWAIRKLFCENNCGNNQDQFVKIVSMKEPPYQSFVENFTFSMALEGRRRIWEDSCMDNIVGSTSLRNQYPTAEDFFQGVFTMTRTDPQIIFDMVPDNSRGYIGPSIPCQVNYFLKFKKLGHLQMLNLFQGLWKLHRFVNS